MILRAALTESVNDQKNERWEEKAVVSRAGSHSGEKESTYPLIPALTCEESGPSTPTARWQKYDGESTHWHSRWMMDGGVVEKV